MHYQVCGSLEAVSWIHGMVLIHQNWLPSVLVVLGNYHRRLCESILATLGMPGFQTKLFRGVTYTLEFLMCFQNNV